MNILFFDTETTGLYSKGAHYSTDFDTFPYIVQIAWQLVNKSNEILIKQDYIIKPDGYKIPDDATAIHHITTEQALMQGMDITTVLRHFIMDCQTADKIVAHNIYFDTSIIKANILKLGIKLDDVNKALDKEKRVDTMNKTVKFVNARFDDGRPGKWPKLEELYFKLFNKETEGNHRSDVDVEILKECYFELKKLKIL